MRLVLCLLLVACEKTGGVETTGGTSTHESPSAPTGSRDKLVATLPSDAGVVAVDATVVVDAAAIAVDAKVARPDRRDEVAIEEAAVARALALIGEDTGPSAGDMSKRTPGADLGRQLDRDLDRQVAVGGGTGGRTRGGGDPRTGTRDDRVGTGKGPSGGPDPVDTKPAGPSGRISVASKQAFDDTTLTADAVLAKIQSVYMAGLKRCYKNYLAKDATARGKLVLSLTVAPPGRVVNGKASGFASEIDDCITGQMSGWRFPNPKDKDGEATDASFAIGLQLVPD